MKIRFGWRALALAALAVVLAAPVRGADQKGKKKKEPFYRAYLVPGDPLDDRISEQEKRVEADPGSAALRNDFGNLLAERRFPKEAREQYEKALDLDRRHFLAAYNLGILEESEGRISRAISAYRKAIRRKPGFPPAHFRLGHLYELRGWNHMAIEEYATALRIDPSMRDPGLNPLVVDSRLMDRVSLANYRRDLATAAVKTEAGFAEPARFRPVPVDRALSSGEVVEQPPAVGTQATPAAPGPPAPPAAAPAAPVPAAPRPPGGYRAPPPARTPTPAPPEQEKPRR